MVGQNEDSLCAPGSDDFQDFGPKISTAGQNFLSSYLLSDSIYDMLPLKGVISWPFPGSVFSMSGPNLWPSLIARSQEYVYIGSYRYSNRLILIPVPTGIKKISMRIHILRLSVV